MVPLGKMEATLFSTAREFLAAPKGPKRIRYSHDAMIDLVIENPWIAQRDIAAAFGYTEGWVSQVFTSDAFAARLAERKDELVDPVIKASIEENFRAIVQQSLGVLRKKLESPIVSDELALGVMNGAAKALGFGVKVGPQINNNFVVQVPGKAASSAEWAAAHIKQRTIEGKATVLGPVAAAAPAEQFSIEVRGEERSEPVARESVATLEEFLK